MVEHFSPVTEVVIEPVEMRSNVPDHFLQYRLNHKKKRR